MDTQPLTVIGITALLLAGGVGFAIADIGGAAADGGVTPATENATVSVGADATVERAPDEATVTVAAVGRGETAAAARNNVSGDAITNALEAEGATVAASRFSVRPEYDHRDGGRELVGYVAVHTVEAETSEVDAVGSLVDTAVDSGADRVEGISYSLSDDTGAQAREAALTTAMDRARGDATTLATAEGRSVGDALTLETSDSGRPVVRAETAADAGGRTNVSPGPVTVEVSVQVTYELD